MPAHPLRSALDVGLQGFGVGRGLRRLVRRPVSLDEARATVADELSRRQERFLDQLDHLVWPHARSPSRLLLDHAGLDRGGVAELVNARGLEPALEQLRDAGVYVSYEEYQGTEPLRRGSRTFDVRREDFFNPVVPADFMGATGASRSSGTAMEMSFAYQRRQAVIRRLSFATYDAGSVPTAIWLPVFPSSAGFSTVMLYAAAGNTPDRWFSQVPVGIGDITTHKRLANRLMPALFAVTGAGLPSPEHVPTSDPGPVVDWLAAQLRRSSRVAIGSYASSVTAAAHEATARGIDLSGVVAYIGGEPVTAGKRATLRRAGITPVGVYAFTPEGAMATSCPDCDDDEYHLWEHELAVIGRRRARSDGVEVDALLLTSLSLQAQRVLLNVENDDFAQIRRDGGACSSTLGELGLRTKLSAIQGMSKVVAGGITINGDLFDEVVDVVLPHRFGGAPGDYQLVETEAPEGTALALRIHPRVGPIDEHLAAAVLREALRSSDNGVLADEVWGDRSLPVLREPPVATPSGKTLALDRLTT